MYTQHTPLLTATLTNFLASQLDIEAYPFMGMSQVLFPLRSCTSVFFQLLASMHCTYQGHLSFIGISHYRRYLKNLPIKFAMLGSSCVSGKLNTSVAHTSVAPNKCGTNARYKCGTYKCRTIQVWHQTSVAPNNCGTKQVWHIQVWHCTSMKCGTYKCGTYKCGT